MHGNYWWSDHQGYSGRDRAIAAGVREAMDPRMTILEAANRQLCTAIRLFFADDDAVAVHTLACAAGEIYEKRSKKAGNDLMFDFVKKGNPDAGINLREALNQPRNFFKHGPSSHGGASLSEGIEFEDSMNDFALLTACHDCIQLCSPNQPSEVGAYYYWYFAVKPDDETVAASDSNTKSNDTRALQKRIDQYYPGLRTASRAVKKRFGASLLNATVAGHFVPDLYNSTK
jgi:hypothetical protein